MRLLVCFTQLMLLASILVMKNTKQVISSEMPSPLRKQKIKTMFISQTHRDEKLDDKGSLLTCTN